MAQADFAHAGLEHAMARFPGSANVLRRLALSAPEFRGLCEDYALAKESLARFEARPDASERPEVGDYRSVIAELEGELGQFLNVAKGAVRRSPDPARNPAQAGIEKGSPGAGGQEREEP
jgi:hypothetical protein